MAGPGPLVVDANVLFSALLRDGTTRHLILFGGLSLHSPATVWDEFNRNREFLLSKSGATPAALDLLVSSLRARIADIPLEVIQPHLGEALRKTGRGDRLDAPYVAAAIAIGGAIWTHDKRLARKARVPCFATEDLLDHRKE